MFSISLLIYIFAVHYNTTIQLPQGRNRAVVLQTTKASDHVI